MGKIVKKSLLAFFVLFYISSVFTSTFAATKLYTKGTSVNMRKYGNTNAAKVYTIPSRGAAVTASGSVSNLGSSKYWTKVTYKASSKSYTGYIRNDLLSKTKPSTSSPSTPSGVQPFPRTSRNFLQIVKNCKAYIARRKFTYSTGSGAIPADSSTSTRTDCSAFVCWCLYEYARANGKTSMKNHYSSHIKSQKIGSTSYMYKITKPSNNPLRYAKAGDILVYDGHIEVYAGSVSNGNAMVYNGGSTSYLQSAGAKRASRSTSKITAIWRVK